ncbi:MAG: type II toxin-antitoxin system RelE/ParE family toxin [Flavipsychrobacter sp.]|nr:type II toxin-antitoxin system RelE/ParE family toxin [Flavipsychrobacter sp.]
MRIASEIDSLSDNPRPDGCKKLKGGQTDLWRIRVGNYRVVYRIDDTIYIVNVQRVGHRKDIYEK